MKLFSLSIGLLLASIGVFYVPVSFAVDGFGLVVNPGGVRTIRASEDGTVIHFPATDGRFVSGDIVTVLTTPDAPDKNALELGTLQREFIKFDAEYLEKAIKIETDLERDRAAQGATRDRLVARQSLIDETETVLADLRNFAAASVSDIDDLNAERLDQLAQLEDLLDRSRELSAIPAQRLATMMDTLQSNRLSVITSKGATFSNGRMILDMTKTQNDLVYSNSIDHAEIAILEKRITDLTRQIADLEALRTRQRAEAEARYLARTQVPQVAVAGAPSVEMRTLQASRADVLKSDALRLLTTDKPETGVSVLVYGAASRGSLTLRHGGQRFETSIAADPEAMRADLAAQGLPVLSVHRDTEQAGAFTLVSYFLRVDPAAGGKLGVAEVRAWDADGIPLNARAETVLPDTGRSEPEGVTEIVGFLENRHAVVLRPGQYVRGSISDPRSGADVVFEARLLERDFSTVDTRELGIRLGSESLATKIIKRGVISQVVVGLDEAAAAELANLPGAVVHLSFPLARQSLFSFLLARDASI